MAKAEKNLYKNMRSGGVRKSVAKELSALPRLQAEGKRTPKSANDALDRLESAVKEARRHAEGGNRRAGARKAARTRSSKARARSAAGRKAAKSRS